MVGKVLLDNSGSERASVFQSMQTRTAHILTQHAGFAKEQQLKEKGGREKDKKKIAQEVKTSFHKSKSLIFIIHGFL